MANIVLCTNAKQATVGLWRRGKLISCTAFAHDEAGHGAFRQWLGQHGNATFHIIADTADEDYRLETLPHVMGRARQEMLARKLNHHYRNLRFRTAQFEHREPMGRRDDCFLMMALTKPDVVMPWLTMIEEAQAPLAGIYLIPFVSRLLVKALQIEHGNLLLTTRHSAGLRQSHFSGLSLRLSRLIPDMGIQPDHYVSETEKTLLYLLNAQVSASNSSGLHLVFAGMNEADTALMQKIDRPQEASSTIISRMDLALQLKIDAELLGRYPDLLHMHLLAQHGSKGNLAPTQLLKPLRLYRLGRNLNIASAACVTGTALFAATNLATSLQLERQAQQLAAQTHQEERRYAEVAANFPKTPIPGNDLKVAVELANKITHLNRTPQRVMQVIGEALDRQQEIRLDRLHWQLADNLEGNDEGGASAVVLSGFHEIGFMEGEILNFSGNYRAALNSVNHLAEQLRGHKQVEQVVIAQQPVNTSSLVNLQGSTLDHQAQSASTARFKLKIVLREPLP